MDNFNYRIEVKPFDNLNYRIEVQRPDNRTSSIIELSPSTRWGPVHEQLGLVRYAVLFLISGTQFVISSFRIIYYRKFKIKIS